MNAGFSRAHERRSFRPHQAIQVLSKAACQPRFTQFETVLLSLFFGLESTEVGFDLVNFGCLIQVTIKNQLP